MHKKELNNLVKPIRKIDAELLAYLKALQEPTPNINALPASPVWNNHPKLNPMQQKFHMEQQHMMRTEWQLMQERRMQEERELTQAHVGGDSDANKRVTPTPVPVAYANICVSGAGSGPLTDGTYAYNAVGKYWGNDVIVDQRVYYSVANSRWQLDVFVGDVPAFNLYNNAAANGNNPPGTGWTRGLAADPAPVIAYAAC